MIRRVSKGQLRGVERPTASLARRRPAAASHGSAVRFSVLPGRWRLSRSDLGTFATRRTGIDQSTHSSRRSRPCRDPDYVHAFYSAPPHLIEATRTRPASPAPPRRRMSGRGADSRSSPCTSTPCRARRIEARPPHPGELLQAPARAVGGGGRCPTRPHDPVAGLAAEMRPHVVSFAMPLGMGRTAADVAGLFVAIGTSLGYRGDFRRARSAGIRPRGSPGAVRQRAPADAALRPAWRSAARGSHCCSQRDRRPTSSPATSVPTGFPAARPVSRIRRARAGRRQARQADRAEPRLAAGIGLVEAALVRHRHEGVGEAHHRLGGAEHQEAVRHGHPAMRFSTSILVSWSK